MGRQNQTIVGPRQAEVLELISQGYNTQQIADRLYISENTVKTHRKTLLRGFGARNTAHLIELTQGLKDMLPGSLTPEQRETIERFCRQIVLQSDCPPEFKHIVDKQFWNLI